MSRLHRVFHASLLEKYIPSSNIPDRESPTTFPMLSLIRWTTHGISTSTPANGAASDVQAPTQGDGSFLHCNITTPPPPPPPPPPSPQPRTAPPLSSATRHSLPYSTRLLLPLPAHPSSSPVLPLARCLRIGRDRAYFSPPLSPHCSSRPISCASRRSRSRNARSSTGAYSSSCCSSSSASHRTQRIRPRASQLRTQIRAADVRTRGLHTTGHTMAQVESTRACAYGGTGVDGGEGAGADGGEARRARGDPSRTSRGLTDTSLLSPPQPRSTSCFPATAYTSSYSAARSPPALPRVLLPLRPTPPATAPTYSVQERCGDTSLPVMRALPRDAAEGIHGRTLSGSGCKCVGAWWGDSSSSPPPPDPRLLRLPASRYLLVRALPLPPRPCTPRPCTPPPAPVDPRALPMVHISICGVDCGRRKSVDCKRCVCVEAGRRAGRRRVVREYGCVGGVARSLPPPTSAGAYRACFLPTNAAAKGGARGSRATMGRADSFIEYGGRRRTGASHECQQRAPAPPPPSCGASYSTCVSCTGCGSGWTCATRTSRATRVRRRLLGGRGGKGGSVGSVGSSGGSTAEVRQQAGMRRVWGDEGEEGREGGGGGRRKR
ncbi:hypothetical protein B0H13DRAFT_2477629 [Mycena leptocephala]|nr:hypothetical protein B0H13DRAFT_2477629 [Mycena leptocephala]